MHLARRYWLDVLIWLLVAVGTMLILVTLQRHGLQFFRYGWILRGETFQAYALALAPLWGAAVLHLLRQRTH